MANFLIGKNEERTEIRDSSKLKVDSLTAFVHVRILLELLLLLSRLFISQLSARALSSFGIQSSSWVKCVVLP